jgi:MFS family permease
MGVSGGFVLSAFAFYLVQQLPESDFLSWGWRVPFLLSIVIFLVGVYIRKNIRESKAFTQAKPEDKHEKIPLLVLVREHPKALLQAIALRLPENGASYIFFTFSVVYAKHIGIGTGEIISAVTLAMLIEFFSILFWGALSDKIGLKPVYYIGVVGLLVMAFPFFWLLSTGSYGAVMLAMFLGLPVCHGAMIGTQPCIMSDLFPVRVRYSGLALGHEVGSIFSGGLGPMLAVALLMAFDASWPVSLLLMAYALLAWIALRSLPSTPLPHNNAGATDVND